MPLDRVLIAEADHPANRAFSEALARENFEVTSAHDGEEAIRRIQAREFDVVLFDMNLPGPAGVDVLHALRSDYPETQVVMMGEGTTPELLACLKARPDDFLSRPLNSVEVVRAVIAAMRRRQASETERIARLSNSIFAADDLAGLPRRLASAAIAALDLDDFTVLEPDGRGHLRVALALHRPELGKLESDEALDATIAGRVAEDRTPALLPQDFDQPRFAKCRPDPRIRSSIVYPLHTGDRLIGVMHLNRITKSRPFRRRDVGRAAMLASHVTLALESSRLVQQLVVQERLAVIGRISSLVLHEIKNPLSVVRSNLTYLHDAMSKASAQRASLDEWRGAIEDAQAAAGAMATIVKDIGMQAHAGSAAQVAFDVTETVSSAVRLTRVDAAYGARIELELQRPLPVAGHPGRICQVLVNLLVNAAQAVAEFPPERRTIGVCTSRGTVLNGAREVPAAIIGVVDRGPGVPDENVPRLFNAFFTTKAPGAGTGLGLHASREIVEAHGGSLTHAHTPGGGATFRLALPLLETA